MRYILLGLLLLTLAKTTRCQVNTDQLLNELNVAIEATPKYDEEKISTINALKSPLNSKRFNSLQDQFLIDLRLYEEYKVFNYDSAFSYAKKLQETAQRLGDPVRIMLARFKLGFCLLSSGMFKETLDSLNKINIEGAPDSIKASYYALTGRFYYDLGDFDNDTYYTPAYTEKGNRYMDSALQLYPPASFESAYYKGLKEIKSGNRGIAPPSGSSSARPSPISDPRPMRRPRSLTWPSFS
jgi:tetratricopeptide (TPR) repeat protein